jgi:hypothetical protein
MKPALYSIQTQPRTSQKRNYRPITLMNIVKIFSIKYLQTEFNNTLKRLYTTIKLVLFQEWKDRTTHVKTIIVTQHINRNKDKNHIFSIDTEKAFDKIQHPLKSLQKLRIEVKYVNIIKAIYDKPTDNTIVNRGIGVGKYFGIYPQSTSNKSKLDKFDYMKL